MNLRTKGQEKNMGNNCDGFCGFCKAARAIWLQRTPLVNTQPCQSFSPIEVSPLQGFFQPNLTDHSALKSLHYSDITCSLHSVSHLSVSIPKESCLRTGTILPNSFIYKKDNKFNTCWIETTVILFALKYTVFQEQSAKSLSGELHIKKAPFWFA